jgi:6-phosphogluconolactonase
MSLEPGIEVLPDADMLADTVARRLLERLASAQAAGGVPQIGLTGGSIAESLHRRIAALSPESPVDWSRVVIWWGDERFVAPDSPDRNAGQAREAFLDSVGVDPAHVHEMPSTADAEDAEAGAAAYASTLREHGAGEFDVLMLGIGPDGHCASLFPGHAALDVDDRVAAAVLDSPKPPPQRITLTFAALNRSRAVWFLAAGAGKAEAVAAALAEDGTIRATPARGVRGREETTWFLDPPAAPHPH